MSKRVGEDVGSAKWKTRREFLHLGPDLELHTEQGEKAGKLRANEEKEGAREEEKEMVNCSDLITITDTDMEMT